MFENSAYADSAWTNNQTGVLAAENLVVNITGTTALIGSIIGSESGALSLNTGNLLVSNLYDYDYSGESGFNLSTNLPLGGVLGKDNSIMDAILHPQGSTTIGQKEYGEEKEQTTKATIGEGEVKANGEEADLTNVNRNLDNTQEITKDIKTGGLNYEITLDHAILATTLEYTGKGVVIVTKETVEAVKAMADGISKLIDVIVAKDTPIYLESDNGGKKLTQAEAKWNYMEKMAGLSKRSKLGFKEFYDEKGHPIPWDDLTLDQQRQYSEYVSKQLPALHANTKKAEEDLKYYSDLNKANPTQARQERVDEAQAVFNAAQAEEAALQATRPLSSDVEAAALKASSTQAGSKLASEAWYITDKARFDSGSMNSKEEIAFIDKVTQYVRSEEGVTQGIVVFDKRGEAGDNPGVSASIGTSKEDKNTSNLNVYELKKTADEQTLIVVEEVTHAGDQGIKNEGTGKSVYGDTIIRDSKYYMNSGYGTQYSAGQEEQKATVAVDGYREGLKTPNTVKGK